MPDLRVGQSALKSAYALVGDLGTPEREALEPRQILKVHEPRVGDGAAGEI